MTSVLREVAFGLENVGTPSGEIVERAEAALDAVGALVVGAFVGAFVGCFVVGMLVTPPDVISQTILAVPMYMLFELGVIASRLIKKEKDDTEETAED